MDIANQLYNESYRNNYNYSQANVNITYEAVASTLHGAFNATNLKPNFAYQLKLRGFPGTIANEHIGLAGRWWQEEWNGVEWSNGQNLNNKGDGTSPNPNDIDYFARRDIVDPSTPTGLQYRYTGYLVFNYFITDENGNAVLNFEANSSYHVLWKTTQRARTVDDGPLKSSTFDADLSGAYPDTGGDDYPNQTVSIFGEWERKPVGGVYLDPGEYDAQMILTEESFHGDGGTYAGLWATATVTDIQFIILPRMLSDASSDIIDAPENDVYFIYPDYQGVKPSGVGYASLSDWTASGFIVGMVSNRQQEVTDTDPVIIDTSTGEPRLEDETIVLFGGPLVNAPVNYYENNRVAPLYWRSVGGNYYWYAANGTRLNATAMSFSQIAAGTQDMFVLETFMDSSDNKVYIVYGYGWKGTFGGGKFFKFIIYPDISSYTDSYYVFKWVDGNSNGFVDLDEILTTPIVSG
jgi:hypothetical protein